MKYFFVFIILLSNFSFGEPLKILKQNPLSLPCPAISSEIQIPENLRPLEEKIVPPLLLKLEKNEPIKVIITLMDPPYEDGLRKEVIAYMEHKFVERNGLYGVENLKGLSAFPIIFAKLLPEKIREIAKDPWVFGIEEDIKLKATRTEGSALIESDKLRQQGGKGKGIGVAVLDTGINYYHPELPAGDKVKAEGDYTGTTETGLDDEGHGTACAGIIAGLSGGMAPEAHLWALKVLDSEGSGDLSYSVEALNDVYDFRNDPDLGGVHLINMSLGTPNIYDSNCDNVYPSMTTIMQKLNSVNIPIIIASGNEGCSNGVSFPSCISYAISVGAVYDANIGGISFGEGACTPSGCTDSTTSADKIACYSNSGNRLDVLAPSHCARTPSLGSGYDSCFGGTSAAAPYTSGVSAQILSLRKNTTPSELKNALKNTGKSITDSRNGITRKRINALEAYQYLTGGTSQYSLWFPVATHASGGYGSEWRTDVGVINKEGSTTNLNFYLYTTSGVIQGNLSIGGYGSGIVQDIVGQLKYTGSGALEVRSDKAIIATSRTYNQTSSGTYGQFLNSFATSEGLKANDVAYLAQLTENSSFRTNIAFTNTGTSSASLTVYLYNSSGTVLASYNVNLSPGEFKQELQPFKNKGGQTNMSSGYAKVVINSGSGIIGYASVVDNKTGDGTTIPLKK